LETPADKPDWIVLASWALTRWNEVTERPNWLSVGTTSWSNIRT
jgi:hypothetical protein